MKSLLAVPVAYNSKVYGRVYLCDKRDDLPFTEEDEKITRHFADALALALDHHRTFAQRHRSAETLRALAQSVSAVTGEEFFRTLVCEINRALGTDYAFVGTLDAHNPGVVHTIAVCAEARLVDNFEYRLEGTPCGNVVGKEPCHYPRGVQALFPGDSLLKEMGIEAYFGYPLFDSAGQAIGLMVVLHRAPLDEWETIESALQLCAGRAAAELERQRAELALRESEKRLRSIVDNSPLCIHTIDLDGRVRSMNAAGLGMLGLQREEQIRGMPMLAAVSDADQDRIRGLLERALRGESNHFEFTTQHGRLFASSFVPVKDESGGAAYITGVTEDITERRQAETALRDRTEQLQLITDTLTVYLQSGNWQQTSEQLLRIALQQTGSEYGFAGVVTEGPVLRTLAIAGIEWDRSVNRGLYEGVLTGFRTVGYAEFRNMNNLFGRAITGGEVVISNDPANDPRAGGVPPGHPPLRSFMGIPLRLGERVVGMIGVANRAGGYSEQQVQRLELLAQTASILYDSYLRQQKEETDAHARRLAEAERLKLASAIEQTADSVLITDPDGVIEYVNPAFEHATGYSRAEALGRKPNLVKSGEHDAAFYQRLWDTIRRGEPFRAVFINRRKDGALYYEEKTITPLKDGQGRITHFVSTGKDITERKKPRTCSRAWGASSTARRTKSTCSAPTRCASSRSTRAPSAIWATAWRS